MQIIFFNINRARTDPQGIINFLSSYKLNTDIFCIQESTKLVEEQLQDFRKIETIKDVAEQGIFQTATFVQKNLEILETKVLMQELPLVSPALYTKVKTSAGEVHVINYHCNSIPVDKLDSAERIKGSEEIVKFLKDLKGFKIIGGDFNLFPETKSIQIIENAGYTNLIKRFKITTTRNEIAWKQHPHNKHYFSDYAFTGNDVKTKAFEVPYSEISDHLPLILNF